MNESDGHHVLVEGGNVTRGVDCSLEWASNTATDVREATLTTALAPTSGALSAQDRCDRCGAQAYIRAVLAGGDLLFCAHHGRRYAEGLRLKAIEIHDETERLQQTPATALVDER